MVMSRVLILINLAIMSINNCKSQSHISKHMNETKNILIISESKYNIIINNNIVLDIEITDKNILNIIRNLDQPIFKIELNKRIIIAKGNNFLSSFVPKNCDYFYPIDDNGKILLYKDNIINLKKAP